MYAKSNADWPSSVIKSVTQKRLVTLMTDVLGVLNLRVGVISVRSLRDLGRCSGWGVNNHAKAHSPDVWKVLCSIVQLLWPGSHIPSRIPNWTLLKRGPCYTFPDVYVQNALPFSLTLTS